MGTSTQTKHPNGPSKRSWVPLPLVRRPPDESSLAAAAVPARTIRLLVVDDHPVVIEGISSCLARHAHITIVGSALDGRDAVRKAKELSPDIALMDINMPDMGGFTATDILRRESPEVKVLILTVYTHPEYLLHIMRSGARGYVLKNAPAEDLLRAIETVYGGDTFFSSEVSHGALNRELRGPGERPRATDLSRREREVLLAVADGLTNKEIASRLEIDRRTVETHRERLTRKLGIHTTAGLTRFAVQTGLISVPVEAAPAF